MLGPSKRPCCRWHGIVIVHRCTGVIAFALISLWPRLWQLLGELPMPDAVSTLMLPGIDWGFFAVRSSLFPCYSHWASLISSLSGRC